MANVNLKKLRKDYLMHSLSRKNINKNPFLQFSNWFDEAIINEESEANAMILATVGVNLKPSVRVVLLKEFDESGFVFFTNYQSKKAKQITQNPNATILFFWNKLERQVRLEGNIEKISVIESEAYFKQRPIGSQISAIVSPQSQVIPNRDFLEKLKLEKEEFYKSSEIVYPTNWGGYRFKPNLFEFWQGRADRLHDRIQYREENFEWILERLAP